jgi:hypothetical protein
MNRGRHDTQPNDILHNDIQQGIAALGITLRNITYSVVVLCDVYADCRDVIAMLNVVLLNVVMLNDVMLNAIILNDVMLNVVMLSVVYPDCRDVFAILSVIMLNVVMLNVAAPNREVTETRADVIKLSK